MKKELIACGIVVILIVVIIFAIIGITSTFHDDKEGDGNINGNGNIDRDSDGDGVKDSIDAFPQDPTQWADRDGDGYGDNDNGINPDAFKDDPTEWKDSDSDGVGDNADICDNGNGGIRINIDSYQDDGSGDEWGSLPDPYFTIRLSTDSDDEWEYSETSGIYWDTSSVDDPFKLVVDIPEDLSTVAFIIEIRDDEWDGSYEPIDYRSKDEFCWSIYTLDTHILPETFTDNGAEDLREGELDCTLKFTVDIVKLI